MAERKKVRSLNSVVSKSFLHRLQELECPYTDDVDETWITELMFKPGELRIRLLQWLLLRFDSKLSDLLERQSSSESLNAQVQRLLFVVSSLGLCQQSDYDLIRGVVSISRQTSFMDMLLDLVLIKDKAENPVNQQFSSPGVISETSNLDDQAWHSYVLLDRIVQKCHIDSCFSTKVNYLPPDLMKIVRKRMENKMAEGGSPVPDFTHLQNLKEEISEDIARQKEILSVLKNHSYPKQEHDRNREEKLTKTLSLVLSDLCQLVTDFSYTFEHEMKQWCNKNPPVLTELGPASKRVNYLLKQFTTLLSAFSLIKTSYTAITNSVNQPQSVAIKHKTDAIGAVSIAARECFQECTTVLDCFQECTTVLDTFYNDED